MPSTNVAKPNEPCDCTAFVGPSAHADALCVACLHEYFQHYPGVVIDRAGWIIEPGEAAERCGSRRYVPFVRTDGTSPKAPPDTRAGAPWYQQGGVEPVDFILSNNLTGWKAIVIEYVFRAGVKPTASEADDIEKAIFWLKQRLLQISIKGYQ